VSYVYEELNNLEEFLAMDVLDRVKENALRWLLYSISQSVLDVLASLIAELGLRKPGSYAELAKPLFKKGFVEELFVNNIARIARFRNRLAYAYRRLSLEELLEEAMWFRVEIRKILAKIMSIAESSGVDP